MAKLSYRSITTLYNGNTEAPSKYSWDTRLDVPGWTIYTEIKLTLKGEVKTKFTVTPPFPPESMKKFRELTFKTTSYKELVKWLKKNGMKIYK